jgi:hypothetical protein
MRFGLWSSSPDWKLARRINRASWGIRTNAEVPEKVNLELEKILRARPPTQGQQLDRKRFAKELQKTNQLIRRGLERYRNDFSHLEDIKHSSEILESERIKRLNEFETVVRELQRAMRLDPTTASESLNQIHGLKSRVSSSISRDRGRELRLKWKI